MHIESEYLKVAFSTIWGSMATDQLIPLEDEWLPRYARLSVFRWSSNRSYIMGRTAVLGYSFGHLPRGDRGPVQDQTVPFLTLGEMFIRPLFKLEAGWALAINCMCIHPR